jgi:hypothetical protein
MKKFSFLIVAMCMMFAGVLSSCFSSGGEIEGSNVVYKGHRATKLNLDGVTTFYAICNVAGLKGYAVVSQETSQDLYKRGTDGLLIFLNEKDDNKLKKLKTPESVADPSYTFPTSARVIEAFCYPNNKHFVDPVDLTVVTPEADGMDFEFYFQAQESDRCDVATDEEGLHTKVPHFSSWIFKMNFEIKLLEKKTVTSEELTTYCSLTNVVDDQKAEYEAPCGFKTETQNPFVTVFLKKWVGESSKSKFTHYYSCSSKPGTEVFCYDQTIYTLSLTSGTRTFVFDVYGTPTSRHLRFVSVDHNGGSGVNP